MNRLHNNFKNLNHLLYGKTIILNRDAIGQCENKREFLFDSIELNSHRIPPVASGGMLELYIVVCCKSNNGERYCFDLSDILEIK